LFASLDVAQAAVARQAKLRRVQMPDVRSDTPVGVQELKVTTTNRHGPTRALSLLLLAGCGYAWNEYDTLKNSALNDRVIILAGSVPLSLTISGHTGTFIGGQLADQLRRGLALAGGYSRSVKFEGLAQESELEQWSDTAIRQIRRAIGRHDMVARCEIFAPHADPQQIRAKLTLWTVRGQRSFESPTFRSANHAGLLQWANELILKTLDPAVYVQYRQAQGTAVATLLNEASDEARASEGSSWEDWITCRGSLLLTAGDHVEGVRTLELAARRKGAGIRARVELSRHYRDIGNLDQATLWSQSAVRDGWFSWMAHFERGLVLDRMGEPLWAGVHLAAATELSVKQENPYREFARLLRNTNSYDLALKVYEHAEQVNPRWTWATLESGHMLRAMGRLKEASDNYLRVIDVTSIHNAPELSRAATNGLAAIAKVQETAVRTDPGQNSTAERMFLTALVARDGELVVRALMTLKPADRSQARPGPGAGDISPRIGQQTVAPAP
jgi:hypothetical protein